jgi:dihydrofolate reductase
VTVRLVWAQSTGGVLGFGGRLPWHLPEDLRRFRTLTLGSTVVMGRLTWASLPERFRPLPERRNLVLSTDPAWSAEGAQRVGSVAEALAAALASGGDLWVIGGASVYAAFLPYAEEVVRTEIDAEFPGDTWAPVLDASWRTERREPQHGWAHSSTGLRYAVSRLTRTVSPS